MKVLKQVPDEKSVEFCPGCGAAVAGSPQPWLVRAQTLCIIELLSWKGPLKVL